MKKTILFLLFIYFFTCNQTIFAASISDTKKDLGYISLNNTVIKEADPDFASVTFTIENTADSAKKASEENNKIANNVINSLKTITSEQTETIKTKNFSISPVYKTIQGKRITKGYKAINSVTVETKDISKISKIIDTAVENGANRTDSLIYSLQNDKSYCSGMYPAIIKDLKNQASSIAKAADTSLDGIKHISASCSVNSVSSRVNFLAKTNSVNTDGDLTENSTPLEAGKAKIKIYVSAEFYVK